MTLDEIVQQYVYTNIDSDHLKRDLHDWIKREFLDSRDSQTEEYIQRHKVIHEILNRIKK